jgi:hypothetical protein
LASVALSAFGQSESKPARRGFLEGFVGVASLYDAGIPATHVRNLLMSRGIGCVIHGSLGYGVEVPVGKTAEALTLLGKDSKLHPAYYGTVGDEMFRQDLPDESTWESYKCNLSLAEAEIAAGLSGDVNLLGLVTAVRNRVPAYIDLKPFALIARLTRVRILRLPFMDAKGKMRTGYKAMLRVEIPAHPELTTEVGISAWNDVQKIAF